ncbi:MAG: signal recognition particle-docking protein FtsY [Candidatus Thermoplasmatota archaeon]|nr:signal recognition particle-docking protein FtsY [Candidatus Thermoplasmatota archaeon]
MGLFDRFKRKVVEAEEESGITVEEGSPEAIEAIAQREEAIRGSAKRIASTQEPTVQTQSQWEEVDDEIEDPFTKPLSTKERKLAARRKAVVENEPEKSQSPPPGNLVSTTGRNLVKSEQQAFEIDLGEDTTNIGGMIISGGPVLESVLDGLEEDLLSADIGHATASEIITSLRSHLVGSRVTRKKQLKEVVETALRGALLSLLRAGYWDFDKTIAELAIQGKPVVVMMVGVNGTGKTTTSAKIAKRLSDRGHSVVLAAADTFRAGAIDQLAAHAERIGIRCVKSQRGGDSAAVARDAIESASARKEDVVIIDTAGRMQNKSNLMEELRKVHRVTQPHLVIFVADALAGNDAVTQSVEFQRMLAFDGAALCKLDTDARGGAALSIAHATGRPIVLAGTGQGYDDLQPFDPLWLLDSIL